MRVKRHTHYFLMRYPPRERDVPSDILLKRKVSTDTRAAHIGLKHVSPQRGGPWDIAPRCINAYPTEGGAILPGGFILKTVPQERGKSNDKPTKPKSDYAETIISPSKEGCTKAHLPFKRGCPRTCSLQEGDVQRRLSPSRRG